MTPNTGRSVPLVRAGSRCSESGSTTNSDLERVGQLRFGLRGTGIGVARCGWIGLRCWMISRLSRPFVPLSICVDVSSRHPMET